MCAGLLWFWVLTSAPASLAICAPCSSRRRNVDLQSFVDGVVDLFKFGIVIHYGRCKTVVLLHNCVFLHDVQNFLLAHVELLCYALNVVVLISQRVAY